MILQCYFEICSGNAYLYDTASGLLHLSVLVEFCFNGQLFYNIGFMRYDAGRVMLEAEVGLKNHTDMLIFQSEIRTLRNGGKYAANR